jgi:hypothetical protein
MAWFARFATPILLPNGCKLISLQDAADYIAALSQAERDAADWRLASEALRVAAERAGHDGVAWAAMRRALNGSNQPPEPEPSPARKFRIVQ